MGILSGVYVPDRFKRVIAQTLKQSPDIITYQEVDQFHYFEEQLRPHNYEGIFFQKDNSQAGRFNGQGVFHEYFGKMTGNSTIKAKDGRTVKIGSDGAAIFWDSTLFTK